jgi:hypothetical protein
MFQDIKSSLQQLYREDQRPWLVGFTLVGFALDKPMHWDLCSS